MLELSEAVLRRSDNALHAPVGADEAVVMSVEAGKYFGLIATARRIWELLEEPRTVAELRDAICAEFEIDAQSCQTDILAFANALIADGLVSASAP